MPVAIAASAPFDDEDDPREIARRWRNVATLLIEQILRRALSGDPKEHYVNPGALLKEAYRRQFGEPTPDKPSQPQFARFMAGCIREYLANHARKAASQAESKIDLNAEFIYKSRHGKLLIELNDALDEFAKMNPRGSQIAEMRFFAGLTEDDIAIVLGISTRTVKRDWFIARAWLATYLRDRGAIDIR